MIQGSSPVFAITLGGKVQAVTFFFSVEVEASIDRLTGTLIRYGLVRLGVACPWSNDLI